MVLKWPWTETDPKHFRLLGGTLGETENGFHARSAASILLFLAEKSKQSEFGLDGAGMGDRLLGVCGVMEEGAGDGATDGTRGGRREAARRTARWAGGGTAW